MNFLYSDQNLTGLVTGVTKFKVENNEFAVFTEVASTKFSPKGKLSFIPFDKEVNLTAPIKSNTKTVIFCEESKILTPNVKEVSFTKNGGLVITTERGVRTINNEKTTLCVCSKISQSFGVISLVSEMKDVEEDSSDEDEERTCQCIMGTDGKSNPLTKDPRKRGMVCGLRLSSTQKICHNHKVIAIRRRKRIQRQIRQSPVQQLKMTGKCRMMNKRTKSPCVRDVIRDGMCSSHYYHNR